MSAAERRGGVVVLHPGIPEHWALWPELERRVRRFIERYDSEADADAMCAEARRAFVEGTAAWFGMLAFLDGAPVGHLLATTEEVWGRRYVTVVQHEMERPIGRNEMEKGFEALLAVARAVGAVGVRILARNHRVGRYFWKRYGFRPQRVLMVKEV